MSTTAPTVADVDALRGRLTGYCYRMLGSAADTDDAVQETVIRAVGNLERFDPGRAALSTWVHAIATRVCLDMLRGARRRALATDLGPAASGGDIGAPLPAEAFVEPMPDSRLLEAQDPGDAVVARETVRLAFVAALQRLPPRQRAVLVLRDVLAFSAREVADALGVSVAAANSALQRARATLEAHRPDPVDLAEPDDAGQRDLLRRYVAAFEAHDVAGLTALLREDATTSMPPFAWWLRGGALIASLVAGNDECAHDRLLVTRVNGGLGFGQYRPDDAGRLRPFALVGVEVVGGRIARTVTFLGAADRFGEFGLPLEWSTPDR
ncbi:sigma-70 family RNA polymerase sigma factor [Beutenbergia cavernae]|uniref:sigma-70 family RNA polymerase sigma factor n=1 Tax=Beutenbergia cavernae TaxID=84757 RepID=UPI0005B8ECF2|nr:sigma-70 family RNA polymerase sigma factor [Beutenbergia cavernae]